MSIGDRGKAIRSAALALADRTNALLAEKLKSHGERDEIHHLRAKAVDAATVADQTSNEDGLIRIERDLLRPLAQQVRLYARRFHIQIVKCPWPPQAPNPNTCAVVAGRGQGELAAAAERIGLKPNRPLIGQPIEEDFWRQIATAELLVVDLLEAERETHWPRICYALGIAMALGRVVVITTDCPVRVPFDLHIIAYDRNAAHRATDLADTLAAATCSVRAGAREPAIATAAGAFALAVDPPTDAWTRHTAQRIAERTAAREVDPIAIRRAIDGHIARPGGAWRVEQPSFRPFYPADGERRCFHVMPFKLDEWVVKAVKEGCDPHLVYERGDTERHLEIIDRMWTGIGRASLIVVDLTGLNPNVCLEYAVARVLGRPIVVCHPAQTWDQSKLFPEIAHLSVELYADEAELARIIRSRIGSLQGGSRPG